ncbi:hypothetical protein CC1G_07014 [Coprinopsis cinerea okayama7|uniref:NAD(P)-binding protein n=1 Tax=Coprinopsis cinerea (strain Okayama-7 / 130 / ATCC MYA-4618 / FGSC 9003) TaxID=240176 RepID=A8NAW1_COPC7|nr:hypothetical protein CC1G_07014 [Coprinopsis cinerea okayama7\|eukprot:XP_001831963.1 hypothetical protein CC1G_07014 [Coprinopsis cinerea okayama7\
MVSLTAIRASNIVSASAVTGSPVAVFVGGTSGIGQGMAEAFGRMTNGNAHIIIVGRNRQAAESVLSNIPSPTSPPSQPQSGASTTKEWTREFIQCDATLMKSVQTASNEILAKHGKINYLIQSPGIMTTGGRDETSEGIDKKLALHYYARWKFIDELLPALRRANKDGEDAKVMSVLGAGYGGEIDVDDLGLVKGYSTRAAALQGTTYNDLMMEEFSNRNPGLTFIHAQPGGVKTNIANNSPSLLVRLAGKIGLFFVAPFLSTSEQCAHYMWKAIFNHAGGAFRTNPKGADIGKWRYFGNEEQRKKLWEHTIEMTRTSVPST